MTEVCQGIPETLESVNVDETGSHRNCYQRFINHIEKHVVQEKEIVLLCTLRQLYIGALENSLHRSQTKTSAVKS